VASIEEPLATMQESPISLQPEPSLGPQRATAAQLLIDMPAESAARLLTRSLFEQLAQLPVPKADGRDVAPWGFAEIFHASVDRLSACVTLYADALTDSVPRKIRRRLRALSRASERRHRADVQLAWLAQVSAPARHEPDAVAGMTDDVAAAAWLGQRASRRRARASASLERAHRDADQLRRVAKRLGTYTTAVRLDDMAPLKSFAAMTGDLVLAGASDLRTDLAAMRPANVRSIRRALRTARRISYLLEPVRVHVDGMTTTTEQLRALQSGLERLDRVAAVVSAILRAGRRAGAQHMTTLLQAELTSDGNDGAVAAPSGASPAYDLRAGLLALARQLRAEVLQVTEAFGSRWGPSEIGVLTDGLEQCARQLGGS
jgi:hypothetical protein